MSNLGKRLEQACAIESGRDGIRLVIQTKDKDIGGFAVRRALPNRQCRKVGPWVFFDHMGPARFATDEGLDVPPHPHIGIATVTYLFEGEIIHRDSLGNHQAIRPGDINLMVAGRGIVHSERERAEARRAPRVLHGLQLWLALPVENEEDEPAFIHYPGSDLPAIAVNGVSVRVMMGKAFGLESPVRTYSRTLYLEADLQAGQSLTLPHSPERAVYVASGRLNACGTTLTEHSMAVFADTDEPIVVDAAEPCRIAVIGGEAMEPRAMEWNFVSSRKERIEQAKDDWREDRFAKVPGDEDDFVPLP